MGNTPDDRPGGEVAKRQLQFFWLADYSGSMGGPKIQTLNQAIRETLPMIASALANYPQVDIRMRAIKFAEQAMWHVGPEPKSLAEFEWQDLEAEGMTATAQALRLLASQMTLDKMPKQGMPPVCVLLSDGYCTDPSDAYPAALKQLDDLPWGRKAVRLSIAIGSDESQYNEAELLAFVSPWLQKEVGVLKAKNPAQLVNCIRWVSVAASVASAGSKSKGADEQLAPVFLPPPPNPDDVQDVQLGNIDPLKPF